MVCSRVAGSQRRLRCWTSCSLRLSLQREQGTIKRCPVAKGQHEQQPGEQGGLCSCQFEVGMGVAPRQGVFGVTVMVQYCCTCVCGVPHPVCTHKSNPSSQQCKASFAKLPLSCPRIPGFLTAKHPVRLQHALPLHPHSICCGIHKLGMCPVLQNQSCCFSFSQ